MIWLALIGVVEAVYVIAVVASALSARSMYKTWR